MNINTHNDVMFADEMLAFEDSIKSQMPTDAFCKFTDVVWPNELGHKHIITDTIFFNKPENVQCVAPDWWGVFWLRELPEHALNPSRRLNFLANRISGERLLMLYELANRKLIDNNHISFNCDVAEHSYDTGYDRGQPSAEQRQQTFAAAHNEYKWTEYNDVYAACLPKIPILLEPPTPTHATLDSEITIVVETYASESSVAFSEKIFRSLQLPRPWLLYCSPGSVDILRSYGFDVLDDLVDHSAYDHLFFKDRIHAMLDLLPSINLNVNRCTEAAIHNNQLLNNLKASLEPKVQSIIDKFK
jgi:hypothetical protein